MEIAGIARKLFRVCYGLRNCGTEYLSWADKSRLSGAFWLTNEEITLPKIIAVQCTRCEFHNCKCRPRENHATRRDPRAHFDHATEAISRDDVDRKAHPERVHALARRDHESLVGADRIAPEKSAATRRAVACNLDIRRERCAGALDYQAAPTWCRRQKMVTHG